MSEKIIIVRRKKRKTKDKKKRKTKPKATMEQKVSQNVKVIINERAKPQRRKNLAVRGFNTPRLSIQPPTIIHKGLDAQSALNSFRNTYDIRVRALERGLNGVNGNIINLTSQLQNNRPAPLNTPQPSGTTPFISDEEGQMIIDRRKAVRLQEEEEADYNAVKRDFSYTQEGAQGYIFENFINPIEKQDPRQAEDFGGQSNPNLPQVEATFDPSVAEAEAKLTVEEAEAERIKEKRRVYTAEEKAELKALQELEQGERTLEFSEEEIRQSNSAEVAAMIDMLQEEDGYKYIDPMDGNILRNKLTEAKAFVRRTVQKNRQRRLARREAYRGGKDININLNRNI